MMNAFAAGTVPAGVIIIGSAWPNIAAPSITALYPARFAWLESTSIDCARVVLGMNSMEKTVAPVPASAASAPLSP